MENDETGLAKGEEAELLEAAIAYRDHFRQRSKAKAERHALMKRLAELGEFLDEEDATGVAVERLLMAARHLR